VDFSRGHAILKGRSPGGANVVAIGVKNKRTNKGVESLCREEFRSLRGWTWETSDNALYKLVSGEKKKKEINPRKIAD